MFVYIYVVVGDPKYKGGGSIPITQFTPFPFL